MGRLTISEGLLGENPRAVAVTLAHELQHALDSQRVALNLLEPDYIALAVRGFVAQAIVTRLLWPDALPDGTVVERNIAAFAQEYEQRGEAGVAARVAGDNRYREQCAQWPA